MKLSVSVQLLVFMKPALLHKSLPQPVDWDALPKGQLQKQGIESTLAPLCRQFFGYHLLLLGRLSSELDMSDCPIKHKIQLTEKSQTALGNGVSPVMGKSCALPFLENSIDAFVLAHELDFARDPHQILREVDRTIIHNGHVAIVGYNPISLAGIFRFLPQKYSKGLKHARCFSTFRIKDWLHLLGFEVIGVHRQGFVSLFHNGRFKWLAKIEQGLRKYLPLFSSRYIIIAKKRVVPLSLIKPKWKPSPKFSAVSASMRGANNSLKQKI